MAAIMLDGIDKTCPAGYKAVDALSLDIQDGEFMVFVGPSGCGMSTALRMVAGLEEISGGVLRIGNRVMNRTPARDRDVAMVLVNVKALWEDIATKTPAKAPMVRCRAWPGTADVPPVPVPARFGRVRRGRVARRARRGSPRPAGARAAGGRR